MEREGDGVRIQTRQFLEFVPLNTLSYTASSGMAKQYHEFSEFCNMRTGIISEEFLSQTEMHPRRSVMEEQS